MASITVVDNGNGSYSCSYTPTRSAAEAKEAVVRQLVVQLNGKHTVGSPFVVEVHPRYVCTSDVVINWVFGSIPAGSDEYELSEGGAVATNLQK